MPPALLYGMVILASASVGHWLASTRSPTSPASIARLDPVRAAPQAAAALVSVTPAPAASVAVPAPSTAVHGALASATPRDAGSGFRPVTVSYERYAALRDPALGSGRTPVTLTRSAVLGSSFQPFPRSAAPVTPAPQTAALQAPADAAPAMPAKVPVQAVVSDLGRDVPVPLPRPAALAGDSLTPPSPIRMASAESDDSRPRVVPPLPPSTELVQDVPVPTPRPAFLTPPAREAQPRLLVRARRAQTARAGMTVVPSDNRTFFEKLFNVQPRPQPTGTALAYAAPDAGGLGLGLGSGLSRATSSFDRYTAIYDISTHTVHLPDGTRLEAHSGLGANLDDPRSVRMRMRGATPPNVYELAPRTELFHGVRAIRLNPTDSRSMYGRDGILAHTYMLGPRGDSNGCVVFKDYRAFLAAFDSGAVRRIAVVSSLN